MNIGADLKGRGRGPGVAGDVARIEALWSAHRAEHGAGGPYLFGGAYTVADVFFTPVASRFETYGVDLGGAAQEYAKALLAHPSFLKWRAAADAEPWVEPRYQFVAPPA